MDELEFNNNLYLHNNNILFDLVKKLEDIIKDINNNNIINRIKDIIKRMNKLIDDNKKKYRINKK